MKGKEGEVFSRRKIISVTLMTYDASSDTQIIVTSFNDYFQVSKRGRRELQLRRRLTPGGRLVRGSGPEGRHEVLLLNHGLQLRRTLGIHKRHWESRNEK